MSPLVRVSSSARTPDVAYVSFDAGRTWLVVRPDGTVTVQYRTPAVPLVFGSYWCSCGEDHDG
jgi:hypothetical protein